MAIVYTLGFNASIQLCESGFTVATHVDRFGTAAFKADESGFLVDGEFKVAKDFTAN